MRSAHWMMAAALACAPVAGAWALEGDGLTAGTTPWPSWQGRLSLATAAAPLRVDGRGAGSPGLKIASASLMGDYYFSRPLWGLREAGGFRATSGLLLGSRSVSLLSTAPASLMGRPFSVDRRSIAGYGLFGHEPLANAGTAGYLGLGYTGLSSKGAWGFSADIGLMALQPGSAVKFGRVFDNGQGLEDYLRDMRLTPLLHLGVSYSF